MRKDPRGCKLIFCPNLCSRKLSWMLAGICVLSMFPASGCKRGFYKRTADRDAYCLIQEKGQGPTWMVQPGFTIEPDRRSRFYDPTSATDPMLPVPAPRLYNYELPQLATRAAEQRQMGTAQATGEEMASGAMDSASSAAPAVVPASAEGSDTRSEAESLATVMVALPMQGELGVARGSDTSAAEEPEEVAASIEELGQSPQLAITPIPREAWLSLPDSCLRRMLEFETVRIEYERSFAREVTESQLDSAKRVNLENILEIALINNRDYQARKELLYRVALRLSLRRFDYDLRFLSRGNGTSLTYTHDRVAGTEVNRLVAGTGVGITRSLYTGGDLIARFANDVVLTFNGPSGYSSSIGSEMFFDLFQPILQRDVRFEPLTQAERDVVYAARDFVRFRKLLFRDLAQQYYSLLLTYRGIAINTQDYFSNLREFNRASATEQAGQIPLFQVDQFEQNVLRSRGNLINSCNALEGALDRLKVRIGLPTELPLNLAITELEELTLHDEASVLREQLSRKRKVFIQKKEQDGTLNALSALTEVARRMLSLAEVNERLGKTDESAIVELQILVALLEAEEKRLQARENEAVLESSTQPSANQPQVLPAQIFFRNKEVIQNTLEAIRQELVLLQLLAGSTRDPEEPAADQAGRLPGRLERAAQEFTVRLRDAVANFQVLDRRLEGIPVVQHAAYYPEMIAEARRQLQAAKQLDMTLIRLIEQAGISVARTNEDLEDLVNSVLDLQSRVPDDIGLAALDVDIDEAMLTALVQRLDLMNRRDEMADAWREIKYAGDDLRSILNLRATQSIRTRSGSSNPFDFTFDDSSTRLSMQFDTPLNRRSERNIFRLALVDYNVTLRNLIEAEDNIKLDIRNDLRAIELDRNQYEIAIASAALAYDRVTSTRMQVALGQGNVSARDFLEAQQAYTQSLSAVAQQHIGYILDRIQFFLDIEQLEVNSMNFWPDLRNEEYPFVPRVDYARSSPHPYGLLPEGPWYSRSIQRQKQVPPGRAVIRRSPSAVNELSVEAETP